MQYELKRSTRAKTLRLAVREDGAVVLTAPEHCGLFAIEKFLAKHAAWATRKVEETKGKTVVRIPRAEIAGLKRRALALVRERSAHFAVQYRCSFKKVSIRAQKSRWGSCSQSGNLSFNYKIAALPAHLRDYIIVHEICHLKEMNHSRAFWGLVARSVPDHRAARKILRSTVFIHT